MAERKGGETATHKRLNGWQGDMQFRLAAERLVGEAPKLQAGIDSPALICRGFALPTHLVVGNPLRGIDCPLENWLVDEERMRTFPNSDAI